VRGDSPGPGTHRTGSPGGLGSSPDPDTRTISPFLDISTARWREWDRQEAAALAERRKEREEQP